jgi:hypothetical protein
MALSSTSSTVLVVGEAEAIAQPILVLAAIKA